MKIIILCGGTGTRLWPMSRTSSPKQFNALISEKSMIEETVDRFRGEFSDDDIYFSTTPNQVEHIRRVFPDVAEDHIIVEPEKRDSGPAMGYVAAVLALQFPDEPIAFIACDHYIHDDARFIQNLRTAEQTIRDTGKMMDIAITPTFPSTALGYTRVGEQFADDGTTRIHHFAGHVEKPDLEKAKELLATKEYLWHANFYMWTPEKFLEAYKEYAPEMYERLANIQSALKEDDHDRIKSEYGQMEKTSIDYAVTEKMDPSDVLIIEGMFGWSDIGAWDVLHDKLDHVHNDDGNLTKGEVQTYDTSNSLVYNMNKDGKVVATIGVEDLVVVDTDDALLVCPKDRSQDVKKLLKELEQHDRAQYID